MDKYQKIRVLGKGSFGSAILIKRKQDGALFVVKEVSLIKMSKKERDEARHECTVLQQLNHPNIVRYVEQFENRNNLYIVMEYCDGGDLAQKIKSVRGPMKESMVMYYFSQVCLAMEYLHSRHILHRDIKTMNVFLTKNGAVKLGDFGISTVLRNTMGMANTVCGTPYYFSPELCRNKPYNNKSDIWALGVLLYECATGGRHPFDGTSMNQLMQRIVKGSYAPLSSQYSSEFRKMVDWCMQKEPAKRPSIKQTLALPIMRQSLERLEENLMLATQCRVRLKDIIDFDVGGDSDSKTNANHAEKDRSPTKAAASPGMTPGQAAAMAMQKQQQQQRSSPSTAQAQAQAQAHAQGGVVGPKPVSPTHQRPPGVVSPYQQQLMVNLQRAQQLRAARNNNLVRQAPPLLHVTPTAASPSEGVSAPTSPSAVSPRSNANMDPPRNNNIDHHHQHNHNNIANNDAFQANMKRIDAIIAKYGQHADPKAKETIHAYMRRKQDEYMKRQKEEVENRERRNNLRQKELQRVIDQQRSAAKENRSPRAISPTKQAPPSPSAAAAAAVASPRQAQFGQDPSPSAAAAPNNNNNNHNNNPPPVHRNPITGEGISPSPTPQRRIVVAANSPRLLADNMPAAGKPSRDPRSKNGVDDRPFGRPVSPSRASAAASPAPDLMSEAREAAEREIRERRERERASRAGEQRVLSPRMLNANVRRSANDHPTPRRLGALDHQVASAGAKPNNADSPRLLDRAPPIPRSADSRVTGQGLAPIQRPLTPPTASNPYSRHPSRGELKARPVALPPVHVDGESQEDATSSSNKSSDADLVDCAYGVGGKPSQNALDALRILRKKGPNRTPSNKDLHPVHLPTHQPPTHQKQLLGDAARYAGMARVPTTEAEELHIHRRHAADNKEAVPSTLEALRSLRNNSIASREDDAGVRSSGQLALLKQRQQQLQQQQQQHHQQQQLFQPRSAEQKRPAENNGGAARSGCSTPRSGSPGPQRYATREAELEAQRRNSVDSYSEMLQHLKDLLQKRKVYNSRTPGRLSPAPPSSPTSQQQQQQQGRAAGDLSCSAGTRSPPSLHKTKAPLVPPPAMMMLADSPVVQLSTDDDDFEDEVPLSPVRCAEVNDSYSRNGEVYSADVVLNSPGELEEEGSEEGYTAGR